MRQGSQIQRARQMESGVQNKQMTAIGYILDTEDILKASWSLSQYDVAAACKFSERSTLQPALSAMDLPGGCTQIFNICPLRKINHHPVESDEPSLSESLWTPKIS